MIKDFFVRKMLERQLKGLPKEEQEKIIKMITENPELFQKIAEEIQVKVNGGINQQTAMMDVLKKYQEDIKKVYK
jgi:ABC-type glutathione transport system ATPase component